MENIVTNYDNLQAVKIKQAVGCSTIKWMFLFPFDNLPVQ